jgi:hypothetical protein
MLCLLGMAANLKCKMNFGNRLKYSSILGGMVFVLAGPVSTPSAQANVYATDVKVNGGFTNITASPGTGVGISYILNEPATLGVTVNILSGTNSIRALNIPAGGPGALRGTNSVVWDGLDYNSNNPPGGVYSVAITAASSGFTNWTQTSTDTNAGNYVWAGEGIAVDRNIASPYYGRVFVSNASPGPGTKVGDGVGILKLNADATPAEESPTNWLSTGGYAWAGDGYSPWKIEVSADDFVYIDDFTSQGVIYRWNPTLSTNSQLAVLQSNNWGEGVSLSGPAIYGSGTNTEIWLADWRSSGGEGIVKYNVTTNGTCATNDTGTSVVSVTDYPFDVALDTNHNIYTIQSIGDPGDPVQRVFRFPAYNPATNGGAAETNPTWATGGGDDSYAEASGIAVDPTAQYVAVTFLGLGGVTNGNTRILSAGNGALVVNLDLDTNSLDTVYEDTDCAWDAVGNVYFTKVFTDTSTPGEWKVFSPPGTNQATTIAVAAVLVSGSPVQPPQITKITDAGGMVTITFTASSNEPPTMFSILGATFVAGPYSAINGATITSVSPGVFQATFSASAAAQFYRVELLAGVPPVINQLAISGPTASINFSAGKSDYPWAFGLQTATLPGGPYTNVSSPATQYGPGKFGFSTPMSGPSRFYRIRR